MSDNDFVLTPELQQAVRRFERIPFNQVLGIQLGELSQEQVTMHLPMKDELIGNFVHGILHGGVISSLLDVTGGAMALIGAFERHRGLSTAERMERLSKLGTIDLRIDYLRPGRGAPSPPRRCCCARATRSRWCARNCTPTTAPWWPSAPAPTSAAEGVQPRARRVSSRSSELENAWRSLSL